MNPIARILIFSGIFLILLGVVWQVGGKFIHLGRLPGDIALERGNFRFYFPVATSILLSVLISLLLWLFGRFTGR